MTPPDNFRNIQHVVSGTALDQLGLIHRVRLPEQDAPIRRPVLVMLHGLEGNEDVTWIFARGVPPDWVIITPRAPMIADSGNGYSWHRYNDGKTDPVSFDQSVTTLRHFLAALSAVYPVDPARITLLGFSQGAAMAYALTAAYRQNTLDPALQLTGVAALAGYIPGTLLLPALPDLGGLPVFQFHGTQDTTIPIALAHKNRDQLIAAHASLTYHEDPVGHKLSSAAMRALGEWFGTL